MTPSVLFLIPSLNYGGAEILLLQQINWLHKNGWHVSLAILSASNDAGLMNQLPLPADHLLVLGGTHSVLNFKALSFGLQQHHRISSFARKHSAESIVAHLPLAHFYGRLVKLRNPGIKLLVYHHSMQYQASPLNSYPKKLFNLLQKALATRADDLTVCVSEAVEANIRENFVVKSPVVLYNAVTFNKIAASDTSGPAADSQGIHLLIPGRLHPAKGHLFFLKIFEQLVGRFAFRLTLEIAGGGNLESELRLFVAQHQLSEIVTITGNLTNNQMLDRICRADFIVVPSLSEGLGIVAIEALMLGKTVVASDAGGLGEVVRDGVNGYLFSAGDPTNCLNQMTKILSQFPGSLLDPDLLRNDYERRFSFEAYIRSFTELLNNKYEHHHAP
ncbi:glycosyltransferase family 4 protein [Paracnuella aquatica]|uniref:glycosyltransferase family 4 protein n=1 Tax=Paracnuella aquatica TaxID=2268757 RepID=UPI00138FF369|nr:glycosyltransferase family 4 protein [Paracnuella aquatica]